MQPDDQDFQVLEHRVDVPFRPRGRCRGHIVFTSPGEPYVYVDREVAAGLRARAESARPLETGGLLAGRVFHDDDGYYAMVVGMAAGPPDAGRPGYFSLSPEDTARLREDLADRYPSADVIGWWHSHTHQSRYSSTDLENQRLWTDRNHLGLLVFAESTPWAVLYLGPESRGPIGPASEPVPALSVPALPVGRQTAPPGDAWEAAEEARAEEPPQPRRARPGGRPLPAEIRRRRFEVAGVVVAGAVTIVATWSLLSGDRPAGRPAEETASPQLARQPQPEPAPVEISWWCRVDGNVASCHADESLQPSWRVDKESSVNGPDVTLTLREGVKNTIRLRVVTGEREHYAGTMTVPPGPP